MTPNPFSLKLKDLRGDMPVDDLAREANVSPAAIYKMETTAKVRWQTVEKTYGRFLADKDEMFLTLILWAMEQTEMEIDPARARKVAKSAMKDRCSASEEKTRELQRIVTKLPAAEADLLVEFSRRFAKNEQTRQMVNAWLSTTKG